MKLKLRIIVNRTIDGSKKDDIILEGNIDHLVPDYLVAKLAFDIEQTLNEHMPAIRVHSDIVE